MKPNFFLSGIFLFAAIGGSSAFAQDTKATIQVRVDGQLVSFSTVGPQEINGRILVPLRGVMEKLGAYVGYDGPSHTVRATRGDIDLQLKIGDATATVNGRTVTLDVPATEIQGSTFVPLRFMGETLGAGVRWDAANQTVLITTQAPPPPPPPPVESRRVDIDSFDSDQRQILRAGMATTFTMFGSPGGIATLQVPGVTTELNMTEVSAGRYQVTFTPPDGPITLHNVRPIGTLRIGDRSKVIPCATPLDIDTEPPVITIDAPAEDSLVSDAMPNIAASLFDGSGSGIDRDSVRIFVDHRDVTGDATVTPNYVAYRPIQHLSGDRHEVRIVARDRAGNDSRLEWSFRVARTFDTVRNFHHNGSRDTLPGQVVVFEFFGDPKGSATFSIGNRVRDLPMRETQPGHYIGQYTVSPGDVFENERVTTRLRTARGEVISQEAATTLGTRPISLVPRIVSPRDRDHVSREFTVTGFAARNARVRIRVRYRVKLLGVLDSSGDLTDQTVMTDIHGQFVSSSIRISGLADNRGASYDVSVVNVGRDGRESPAATLTVTR